MEPPPAPPLSSAASTAAVVAPPPQQTHLGYADSVDSSPRSRNTDSWDESLYPAAGVTGAGGGPVKLRLMCSYGGHIVPRPHSKSLCYVGGDTRIVVVDRHTTLSDLTNRLSKTLFNGRSFTLKYQLPNEDLDSLISVTTDEDLENMIDEYDRLNSAAAATATATAAKSSRLRLFLFPSKPDSASSIGSLLENSTKSDDWFLNALNGTSSGFSESASVNCLLGLDDDAVITPNANSKDVEAQIESFGNVKGVSGGGGGGSSKHGGQDIHSVPDSPMLETTSSFGSASSSPSLANLPPIRVHVEDQKIGIEEQFSQMSVMENAQQKHDDGGFAVLSSQPTTLTTVAAAPISGLPMSSPPVMVEYPNRVFSDDERSEQGIAMGYRKLPVQQAQLQQQTQIQYMPQQLQPRQTGGLDSVSPDSVSSEGSMKNPLSRQKPTIIYQEPIVQIPATQNKGTSANPVEQPKITDPNTRVQIHQQQIQDSGYILQTQFDPQHHHPQMHPQQQFIHAGAQYIHHHPTGMPMASYYPVYPSQQQHHPQHAALDQQYPVYYMPARQTQAYNMSVQQPNYTESAATAAPSSRPQTPPPSAMGPPASAYNPARNPPAPARTATTAAPSLVQVPSSQYQPQYVGYSQIHPSQSIAPTSAANANYAYEYADPTQAHMYYTHAVAPQLAAQYQTMAAAAAGLAEDNMKQQQQQQQVVGASQP